MPNEPTPRPEHPSAKQKAAQLRNHESRFLKALKLLIESGKAKTIEDLIRYAEQDRQVESVVYLRSVLNERLPVDLAYDALSVNLRLVAHKRNNSVLQDCLQRQVGLIMPLPPHIIDAFVTLMPITILHTDGHHLPVSAESGQATLVRGSRAARAAVGQLNAFVFELFGSDSSWVVDAEVADVLDSRWRDPNVLLIAHLRPHQNPNDVELPIERHRIQLL